MAVIVVRYADPSTIELAVFELTQFDKFLAIEYEPAGAGGTVPIAQLEKSAFGILLLFPCS